MRSFKDLIKDVHDKGFCQQCGGCVSFCNSIEHEVIGFKKPNSPPSYLNKDKCLRCGICYLICPQTHSLEDEVKESFKFKGFKEEPLGFYYNLYSCQSIDEEFLKNGTDGGVVTALLNFLLEKKLIDGAIVAKTLGPFSREVMVAKSREDLLGSSGIKLDVSPQLSELQKFQTYIQSLPKLRQLQDKRLAIVGTPCQIYTIRCMQELEIMPAGNIEYCFGLFCYENFFFDVSQIENLEGHLSIKYEDIESIKIKEDLIIIRKDGKEEHHYFDQLEDFMSPACSACADFTNVYGDLSFGGLGSPDKYTTILARTSKGRGLIFKALKSKILKCRSINSTEKTKILNKISKYCQLKIERQQKFFRQE